MSSAQSTDHSSAAVASRRGKNADVSLAFSASKIRTIPGDIGNVGHQQRCGSCSTERLGSKKGSVHSAAQASRITTRLCRTTSSPKGWEGLGETTTRITSKRFIGDAIY